MIKDIENTISQIFNREVVFSIDASKLLPEIYNLIEGLLIYEDHFEKKYLVPIHENDLKYPELRIKIDKHNISFSKVGKLTWLSINELHFMPQKFKEYLNKSKRLDEIDETIFYPTGPIYGGRLYHLVHYNYSSSQQVSDRLMDLFNFYNNEFGEDTFRIEQIRSGIRDPIEFIKKYSPSSELIYMKIKFRGKQNKMVGLLNYPTLSIEKNGFIIKINDSIITIKLEDLENLFGTPQFSPLIVFGEAKKMLALGVYLDASCDNYECTSNVVVEGKMMKYFVTIMRNLLSHNFNFEINEYLVL